MINHFFNRRHSRVETARSTLESIGERASADEYLNLSGKKLAVVARNYFQRERDFVKASRR